MDKTTEDLIELGRRLGRLEAENEALRKAASNGHTPVYKEPDTAVIPKAPEPPPLTTPSSMILELLTDSHPQEFNAHMVSLQLGIAKHIALETMEELTKNGFLRKVNVGRYVAKNSREKLEKSSLLGTREIPPKPAKPTVASRYKMHDASMATEVLNYLEAHTDKCFCSLSLSEVITKYSRASLRNALGNLCKDGRLQLIDLGWYAAISSNKSNLRDYVKSVNELKHDVLQKSIYDILSANMRKSYTVKELTNMVPPVPPMDKLTEKEVMRAIEWLMFMRKVVNPEPGRYTKRLGPMAK